MCVRCPVWHVPVDVPAMKAVRFNGKVIPSLVLLNASSISVVGFTQMVW